MKKLLFLLAVMLIAAGMCVAQTGATSPSGSSANQGTSASSSANGADQSTAGTTTGAANDQSATGTNANAPADNSATAANGKSSNGKLPQTASPLPLLALLGMGSLGTGLVNRFRK